jgi:hypothetical protein
MPRIFVRYGPLPATAIALADGDVSDRTWVLNATAALLVSACQGVYAMVADDPGRYSLRKGDALVTWTNFDSDLATALGIDGSTAVRLVRELCLTDRALLEAAFEVAKWTYSGQPPRDPIEPWHLDPPAGALPE